MDIHDGEQIAFFLRPGRAAITAPLDLVVQAPALA
jgi:hypothetical protein